MSDRRDPLTTDRRKMLKRPTPGRRLFEQAHPDTPAIVVNLRHWATLCEQQGHAHTKALCLIAAARLEELEALVTLARARQSSGGQARAEKLTPEQRAQIASHAAQARHTR